MSASHAASGRNASEPVAELAVRMPTTRPRRAVNQRLATVAPSTIAVMPVPMPTSSPQVSQSCHSAVICVAKPSPTTMKQVDAATTARSP